MGEVAFQHGRLSA